MNNLARRALVVVGVIALLVFGIRFLIGGPLIGSGPSPSPVLVPSPTVASTTTAAAPTATVVPSPSASPIVLPSGDQGLRPLDPGTYIARPFTQAAGTTSFILTIPEGWQGDAFGVSPVTGDQYGPPTGMALLFNRPNYLEADPCHWMGSDNDIALGPTVDDLVDALVAHPSYATTTPTAVTLGGYQGTRLDVQMPGALDVDFSTCDEAGQYRIWSSDGADIYAQGPGTVWHLWLLDVDGERVDVMVMDYPGTPAGDRAEIQLIVDSIRIQP